MYEIKENERESNSEWKYYIRKNGKVVKAHLTLKEAENIIKNMNFLQNEK